MGRYDTLMSMTIAVPLGTLESRLSGNCEFLWPGIVYRSLPRPPSDRELYREYLMSLATPQRTVSVVHKLDQAIRDSGWGWAGYIAAGHLAVLDIAKEALLRLEAVRHVEMVTRFEAALADLPISSYFLDGVENRRLEVAELARPHNVAWRTTTALESRLVRYIRDHVRELDSTSAVPLRSVTRPPTLLES